MFQCLPIITLAFPMFQYFERMGAEGGAFYQNTGKCLKKCNAWKILETTKIMENNDIQEH